MSEDLSFQDRMFLESEAVYQRITDGQVDDVDAELTEAQFRASEDGGAA